MVLRHTAGRLRAPPARGLSQGRTKNSGHRAEMRRPGRPSCWSETTAHTEGRHSSSWILVIGLQTGAVRHPENLARQEVGWGMTKGRGPGRGR